MTRKNPLEVRRKELQKELSSAIRRKAKQEEKIERLLAKLDDVSKAVREAGLRVEEGADDNEG